jgi:hypothetical protein
MMATRRTTLTYGPWVHDQVTPHLSYRRVRGSSLVLVRHDTAYSLARISDELGEQFCHIDYRPIRTQCLLHAANKYGWKMKPIVLRELKRRLAR